MMGGRTRLRLKLGELFHGGMVGATVGRSPTLASIMDHTASQIGFTCSVDALV